MRSAIHVPEYAKRSVVVIVPIAAFATFIPDFIARILEIPGQFFTTSYTAEVISTLKSITEPLAPMQTEAIKI